MVDLLSRVVWAYARLFTRCNHWVIRALVPERQQDPHIERLQRTRAFLGAGLIAVVIALTRSDRSPSVGELSAGLLEGAFVSPFLKGLIALPCFVVFSALLAWARPASRRETAGRAGVPLGATAAALLAPTLPFVILAALAYTSANHDPSRGFIALSVLALVISPVLVVGAFLAVFLSVRYTFRSADVHPMLPAVIGLVVAVATALGETLHVTNTGPDYTSHDWVISLGGAGTLAALSAYEIRRLFQSGVRLGSPPAPRVPPAPHGATPTPTGALGSMGTLLMVGTVPLGMVVGTGVVAAARDAGRTPPTPGTYPIAVPFGPFGAAATLNQVRVTSRSVRFVLTFRNSTSRAVIAVRCPAEGTRKQVAQWGLASQHTVVALPSSYCQRNPGRAVHVQPGKRTPVWIDFPRDRGFGGTFDLSWPTGGGTGQRATLRID